MIPAPLRRMVAMAVPPIAGFILTGILLLSLGLVAEPADASQASDGSILPFPPVPSASVAGQTLQESKMQRRVEPGRLPKDAPNILIILLDDVGFGLPDTYGGSIHTPTLSKLAEGGISYNAFHTTAICSPTRAALLTGRNHQRVGSGTIAERAVDWDGYTGVIPRTSATLAKVRDYYGYKTAAFGKWHNTPATETTAMGPFTLWPTGQGIGFDYFYGAGWAWAGDTPFHHTKLIASHFGGTRNPMAISWPKRIKPDRTPRLQFHHVNDIVPTIYEILGIRPPTVVDGFKQDPIDGVSIVYTFADANALTRKRTQYFDNNGSRGIYHDGWFACTFGPLTPWLTVSPGLATWDSNKDVWELYRLGTDFSQAENLAAKESQRLEQMKSLFLQEAKANKVFPIGAGIWLRIHPEDRVKTPYTSWQFDQTSTRMPEFAAPGLGRESNRVTVEAELGENATGVLYALGGASGGLTLYMDQGDLIYEYNMKIIERYTARSSDKIAPGKRRIEVDPTIARPGAPAEVVIKVDSKEVARTTVKRTVPAAFTASETFDVGVDLGSPVSIDYFDRRPFAFNGAIKEAKVELK
jgi:hypothetical protein